jgi:hypothetical protein
MSSLAQRLEREFEEIGQEYQTHFAGQSRLDRDLSRLDKLLARTNEVVKSVQGLPDAVRSSDLNTLLQSAKSTLALYQAERREIEKAQTAGPVYSEFGELASRANFVFARYRRHFAGQSRGTRDLGLISEMISDLDKLHGDMKRVAKAEKNPTFDTDVELVLSNKKMYEKERGEIEKAFTEGTDEDKANRLGAQANGQFGVYRVHFAGASRVSRRPVLLSRTVDTLKRILADMNALSKKGFAADFHPKNIEVVKSQLAMYEAELEEIRKAKKSTSMDDLMGALGETANNLFQEYRDGFAGKNRGQVDREKLASICDRLGEVLRQMDDLAAAQDNDMNEGNRAIVLDQLTSFETEYEAVLTAQKNA